MASEEQIRILISAVDEASRNLKSVEEGLKGMTQASGETHQASEKASSGMNMMGNAANLAKMAIGALGISLTVDGIRRLAEMGAASLAQEGAFKNLAAQAGMSSESMLNAMRTASDGTVSEMELVSIGAKTLATGLSLDLGQMSSMMLLAKDRANAFGIETSQAYETITRAIEYQSPRMLRSVGLVLDAKEAYRVYAESIHKSADALTEQEQQQAFFNAILKQGQGELGNLSGGADKAEDSMKRAKVAAENLALAFGKLLAPAIGDAAQKLSEFLNITKDGIDEVQRLTVVAEANRNGLDAYNEVLVRGGSETEALTAKNNAMGEVMKRNAEIFTHGSASVDQLGKSIKDAGTDAAATAAQLEDLKKKAEAIATGGLKATISFAAGGVDDFSKQEEARAKYNASAVKSNGELQAALTDQTNKSGDARAKLEQEWQDKIAWVQLGAKERTKEGEIEAETWWNNIYADKMKTLDEANSTEISKIKDKYKTQNQLAASQRATELADAKKASEERLQVIALELLSQSGKLDQYFGGVKLSGKDAFDAIRSGVIKVGPELANEMSGAMNTVKIGQGLMADNAKTNSTLMSSYFKDGGASIRQTFRETSGDVALKYEQMGYDERRFIDKSTTDSKELSTTHMTNFGMMGDKTAEFSTNSQQRFSDIKGSAVGAINDIHQALDDLPKNTDIWVTTHHKDVYDNDDGDKKKKAPPPLPGGVYPQQEFASGVSNFIVPPGYPNDSFMVGLTTGERVNVDSPKNGGGSGASVTLYFQSLVPPNDYEMARIAQKLRPYLQRQEGRE